MTQNMMNNNWPRYDESKKINQMYQLMMMNQMPMSQMEMNQMAFAMMLQNLVNNNQNLSHS